jgi:hypothetical protein
MRLVRASDMPRKPIPDRAGRRLTSLQKVLLLLPKLTAEELDIIEEDLKRMRGINP